MEELLMAAAGGLSSAAGSALAGAVGGGSNKYTNPEFVDMMNNILNQARNKALGYSEQHTNQAVGQQNNSLSSANQTFQQYLQSALSGSNNALNSGLTQYQQLQQPVAHAGQQALSAYMNSLGLPTANVGYGAMSQAQQQAPQFNSLLQSALQSGTVTRGANGQLSLANAPTAPTNINSSAITPQQLQQYLAQHTNGNLYNGVTGGFNPAAANFGGNAMGNAVGLFNNQGGTVAGLGGNADTNVSHPNSPAGLVGYNHGYNLSAQQLDAMIQQNPTILNAIKQYLANQQNQTAQSQYNTSLNNYNTGLNNLSSGFNNLGSNPLQSIAINNAMQQGLIS